MLAIRSGPGQRHVQGDAAAIGVADEVNFLFALFDESDRLAASSAIVKACSPVHGPLVSQP